MRRVEIAFTAARDLVAIGAREKLPLPVRTLRGYDLLLRFCRGSAPIVPLEGAPSPIGVARSGGGVQGAKGLRTV